MFSSRPLIRARGLTLPRFFSGILLVVVVGLALGIHLTIGQQYRIIHKTSSHIVSLSRASWSKRYSAPSATALPFHPPGQTPLNLTFSGHNPSGSLNAALPDPKAVHSGDIDNRLAASVENLRQSFDEEGVHALRAAEEDEVVSSGEGGEGLWKHDSEGSSVEQREDPSEEDVEDTPKENDGESSLEEVVVVSEEYTEDASRVGSSNHSFPETDLGGSSEENGAEADVSKKDVSAAETVRAGCAAFTQKPVATPISARSLRRNAACGTAGGLTSYSTNTTHNGPWSDFPRTSFILTDFDPGPELVAVLQAVKAFNLSSFEVLTDSIAVGAGSLNFSSLYLPTVQQLFNDSMIHPEAVSRDQYLAIRSKPLYMQNQYLVYWFPNSKGVNRTDALAAIQRLATGERHVVVEHTRVRKLLEGFEAGAHGEDRPHPALSALHGYFEEVARTREDASLWLHANTACEQSKSVSFLVQYFRRPAMITKIVPRLRSPTGWPPAEIIVNNDGAESVELWNKVLHLATEMNEVSGYQVLSGNIHEIRAYNRLARMARGSILVLLQDDDMPPWNIGWVARSVRLFEMNARLALVSGLSGLIEGGRFTGKYSSRKGRKPIPPGFKDSRRQRFMFASLVNMGPFVVRRSTFRQLGMFHQDFSCRGEPGIGYDYEYSLRCWQQGYQVGVVDFKFEYQADGNSGGTRSSPPMYRLRESVDARNWLHIKSMYSGFYVKQEDKRRPPPHLPDQKLRGVQKLVTAANRKLLAHPSRY